MFCTQPIHGLGAASCRRGRRFAVPCGGRRGASLFPGRTAEKALRCFPLTGLYGSTAEKPPTGRFFWTLRIGSLSGGFSLTKAPSFAIRISDCKIHPQRRLTILVFRALRSSTSRRCPLDTCHLLKKVDENFFLSTNWVPRGKSQGLPPNQ